MLKASVEEIETVREYFEWQAPDLQVTFMQKVYSEAVMNARHDVWDIHTNKDRWWVITGPTNLYSQQQFPNLDLALTFHLGLILRMPRTDHQRISDMRLLPFGAVFEKMEAASDAVSQAHGLADYQGVGVRCRETLLDLIGAAQDAAVWTDSPPQRANFRAWVEIICNALLPGDTNRERRGALKGSLDTAWTFSNWLTHAKGATWVDADMAHTLIQHAIGMASTLLLRELRGAPDACPHCGAPDLQAEQGETTAPPNVLWEQPRCPHCGWAGRPVPILDLASGQAIMTREGEPSDQHGIMAVPFRGLRKPGDPPTEPLQDIETDAPEPTEYFAYGSNMATARLRKRMPSAEPLGVAILPGHELRFHKRSKRDKSAKCDAFATDDDDSACMGVLFRFDPAERASLDLAEGAGKGYDAKVVTVINSQGRRRKALTYLASPDAIDDTLKPYSWYKAHVLAGAMEHGLPHDYIALWIEAVDAVDDPDVTRDRTERAALTHG